MIAPTQGNLKQALKFISPNLPQEEWVRIGIAIKERLSGDGFKLFNEWSHRGQNYSENDTKDAWKSIKACGKVTVGTLFYIAGQNRKGKS